MNELKKIFLFVALFATALVATDRLIGVIMKNIFSSNYTGQSGGKINYYLRRNYEPELLIMGDSRALNQVMPEYFKINAYNISHAGMDDVFQEALLDLLLSKNKKPEYILLHIDPEYYTGPKENIEKAMYLKPFYGQAPLLTKYINESGPYEKFKFFFISYRYNNIVLNMLNNSRKNKTTVAGGFEPIPASAFDSARTMITAAIKISEKKIQPNFLKLKRLQRISIACKKNNIRLILFTAPVFYKKNLRAYSKINYSIDSLCKKNNLSYLNYTNVNLSGNLKEEFRKIKLWNDCFHLNEQGAKIFSNIISSDLDSLISVPRPMQ